MTKIEKNNEKDMNGKSVKIGVPCHHGKENFKIVTIMKGTNVLN